MLKKYQRMIEKNFSYTDINKDKDRLKDSFAYNTYFYILIDHLKQLISAELENVLNLLLG